MKQKQHEAGVALAALLLTSGCVGGSEERESLRGGSADYPTYDSVAQLVDRTDVTVEITIGNVASKELDNGGDAADTKGVPMAFWNAEVVSVLEPDSGLTPGDAIVVGWPDLDKIQMEDRTALKSGQTVVLFARRLTPKDAPGIDTQEVFYIPLGGDNGVMDVAQDRAIARSEFLHRLPAKAEKGQATQHLSVSLAELKSAVAAQHRKND